MPFVEALDRALSGAANALVGRSSVLDAFLLAVIGLDLVKMAIPAALVVALPLF